MKPSSAAKLIVSLSLSGCLATACVATDNSLQQPSAVTGSSTKAPAQSSAGNAAWQEDSAELNFMQPDQSIENARIYPNQQNINSSSAGQGAAQSPDVSPEQPVNSGSGTNADASRQDSGQIPPPPPEAAPGAHGKGVPQPPQQPGIPEPPKQPGIPQQPSIGIPNAPAAGIPNQPSAGVPNAPAAGIPNQPSAVVPSAPRPGGTVVVNKTAGKASSEKSGKSPAAKGGVTHSKVKVKITR